jgi:riboflavin synthase
MFTGLVEEVGAVQALSGSAESLVMTFTAKRVLEGVETGDSICVNGVCLTVTSFSSSDFSADVMKQTLSMSSLGNLQPGSPVNLERALTPTTKMGGHMVQGHVDATASLLRREPGDNWEVFTFSLPSSIARYVVPRGSIAIEGVSLTVAEVSENDEWFQVSLIPTTLMNTNLGSLVEGSTVNIESDVLARHVEKLMKAHRE